MKSQLRLCARVSYNTRSLTYSYNIQQRQRQRRNVVFVNLTHIGFSNQQTQNE